MPAKVLNRARLFAGISLTWAIVAIGCSDDEAQPSSETADDTGSEVANAVLGERYDYVNDVAPILARYCIDCHTAGGGAPFALDSYRGARRHAGLIANAVRLRIMPPCRDLPEDSCPRPSDEAAAVLAEWAAGSRPERLK